MNLREIKSYFNNQPVEYVPKETYTLIEDREYDPKFSLKGVKEVADIPINEPIKCTEEFLIKAIKYGMILMINYKGEKDSFFAGHERVVYPMVIGYSSKKKPLLRGWHLNGWSVSNKGHIDKIWRLFRVDRILSVTFTGSFYRLSPPGYNMNDKGMRGGILAKANFNEIRKNQQVLVNKNKIQNKEEITLSGDNDTKFATIIAKDLNYDLDLTDTRNNEITNNIKNMAVFKMSFLKSIYGNKYIAILGAIGQPGNTVKIFDEHRKNLGVYKVLDSISGKSLADIKKMKGNTVFKLYMFDKKI